MTPTAVALMAGLDDNAVDFEPTYDGEEMEPKVMPSSFPNLLANGSKRLLDKTGLKVCFVLDDCRSFVLFFVFGYRSVTLASGDIGILLSHPPKDSGIYSGRRREREFTIFFFQR